MRTKSMLALLAALALAACSKEHKAAQPSARTVERDQAYRAPPQGETVWDEAWDAVTVAGDEFADAGEWTFEKAEDGAIVVYRGVKRVAGETGDETQDAATLAAVKSRLAASDDVDATEIDVDVNDGIVTLRGHVDDSREAAKAVRVALGTRGVDQVVSYLTWS